MEVEMPVAEPDEHRLQFGYVLWFSHRPGGKTLNVQPYDQNLKIIGAFNTVSCYYNFWMH